MGGFLTLGLSLDYDNVKLGIQESVDEISISEGINLTQSIEENYETIRSTCNGDGHFVYSNNGTQVSVPCEIVSNGTLSITNYIIEKEPQMKFMITNITEEINNSYSSILASCQNPDSFVFIQEDYGLEVDIPCLVVNEGLDSVIAYSFDNLTEQIYYEDYQCDYWNCVREGKPFVIISHESKDYWMGKFYIMLIISIVFSVFVYFLVDDKMNFPLLVGILLIISVLPLFKLYEIILFLADKSFLHFLEFLGFLFNASGKVFNISLIVGILLIGLSIGLRFFRLGNWLSSLGKKEEDSSENDNSNKK